MSRKESVGDLMGNDAIEELWLASFHDHAKSKCLAFLQRISRCAFGLRFRAYRHANRAGMIPVGDFLSKPFHGECFSGLFRLLREGARVIFGIGGRAKVCGGESGCVCRERTRGNENGEECRH